MPNGNLNGMSDAFVFNADLDSTFKGANKITSADFTDGSVTISDSISDQDDIDIFRFHLNAGETVDLSTSTANGITPDTLLTLYDHQGNLITFNDDAGLSFDSQIVWTAPEEGNYFVSVTQWPAFPDGDGDFSSGEQPPYYPSNYWTGPGDYDLTIEIV